MKRRTDKRGIYATDHCAAETAGELRELLDAAAGMHNKLLDRLEAEAAAILTAHFPEPDPKACLDRVWSAYPGRSDTLWDSQGVYAAWTAADQSEASELAKSAAQVLTRICAVRSLLSTGSREELMHFAFELGRDVEQLRTRILFEKDILKERESSPKRKAAGAKGGKTTADKWRHRDAEEAPRVRAAVQRLMDGGMTLTAARQRYQRNEGVSMHKIREHTEGLETPKSKKPC